MKEYAITLTVDPERRLISVCATRIHYDIGEGFQRFKSIEEAEKIRATFKNWAWQGTEIVEVEEETKEKR